MADMTNSDRGTCPDCGQDRALTRRGLLRLHTIRSGDLRLPCGGAGQQPKEVRR